MPTLRVEDPWAPSARVLDRSVMGSGARHDFSWFLEGTTAVNPANLEEIRLWLLGCTYASDPDVFHERDYWQHPKTFEHLRKGDCEDFALWTWRKLLELGFDARFYLGRVLDDGDWRSRHAWVVFDLDGQRILMEPSSPTAMLTPFDSAKANYEPYFYVGRDCKPTCCEGYIYYLQRRDGPAHSDPGSGLTSACN